VHLVALAVHVEDTLLGEKVPIEYLSGDSSSFFQNLAMEITTQTL